MSDAMSGLHLLGADPLKQTPAERQAAWEAGNRASMEIAARGAAAHDANMAAFANMKPVERKRYFQMYPGLEQTFLASPYAAVAASATQCAADGDNGSWMFWILCMLLMWLFWRVAGHWAQAPPRHHASRGGYVAEPAPPAKADVIRFQQAIAALPADKQAPEFVAMTKADPHGTFGPKTKAAAKKFNELYSWNQGSVIDAGTLESLNRPDLKPGYAEKMAAIDAEAARAAEAAAAAARLASVAPQTAAKGVQDAARDVEAAARQAVAQAPAGVATYTAQEAESLARSASAMAASARTSEEVVAAARAVEDAAEKARAAAKSGSWWTRPAVGPVPEWGVVAGGAGLLAIIVAVLVKMLAGGRG